MRRHIIQKEKELKPSIRRISTIAGLAAAMAVGLAAATQVAATAATTQSFWTCTTPVISKDLDSDNAGGWWVVDVDMTCSGPPASREWTVNAFKQNGANIFHEGLMDSNTTHHTHFTVPATPLNTHESACVYASSQVHSPVGPGANSSRNLCWSTSWAGASAAGAGSLDGPSASMSEQPQARAATTDGSANEPAISPMGLSDHFCVVTNGWWETSTDGRSGTVKITGNCAVNKARWRIDTYVNGEWWHSSSGTVSGVGTGNHTITDYLPSMPTPNDPRGNYTWANVTYEYGDTWKVSYEMELGYLRCSGC